MPRPVFPGRGIFVQTLPMKILKLLKSALVTGLFVVLPAWLALLLFLKVLVKLGVFVKPIATQAPEGANHPTLIALVVFILICVIFGGLFHTRIGKIVGHAIEDGCLAPAFLIETHADGLCTVFMPSVPTPMAGGVFIMPSERVHEIDVPVPTMMKCISKWGSGTTELLAALK